MTSVFVMIAGLAMLVDGAWGGWLGRAAGVGLRSGGRSCLRGRALAHGRVRRAAPTLRQLRQTSSAGPPPPTSAHRLAVRRASAGVMGGRASSTARSWSARWLASAAVSWSRGRRSKEVSPGWLLDDGLGGPASRSSPLEASRDGFRAPLRWTGGEGHSRSVIQRLTGAAMAHALSLASHDLGATRQSMSDTSHTENHMRARHGRSRRRDVCVIALQGGPGGHGWRGGSRRWTDKTNPRVAAGRSPVAVRVGGATRPKVHAAAGAPNWSPTRRCHPGQALLAGSGLDTWGFPSTAPGPECVG